MVERTKTCAHCHVTKPWSAFHAKVRWPDGTMRQPHSRCKTCQRAARALRYKQDWQRIKNDPELLETERERHRQMWRKLHGAPRIRRKTEAAKKHVETKPPKVDAAPFLAWVRYVAERDAASMVDTAARLGVPDRSIRRIRDQGVAELDTVERALIADGTIGLEDLYPDLSLDAR